MASALKRIITNQDFRRRINVEEQHAQKYDRFLRGRQIVGVICEHFRTTGAHDAALDQSDASIQDGTKLYYLQVKYQWEMYVGEFEQNENT